MRKLIPMLLLLALALPAAADERARPEELAREGAEKLMRALELFIESLPRFEAPRVAPNGDIVIPRVPQEKPERDAAPAEPETLKT